VAGEFEKAQGALESESKVWSGYSADLSTARRTVQGGIGQESAFGPLGRVVGVAGKHQELMLKLDSLLAGGSAYMQYLSGALIQTARHYEAVDGQAVQNVTRVAVTGEPV
jgi:hypothetical protein